MAKIESFELFDAVSGEHRSAELWDTVELHHREDLKVRWPSALADLQSRMPEEHREESSHWNWLEKLDQNKGVIGRQAYLIECGNTTQAVMLVDLNKASRFSATKGESIVYVDYVSTAPWNWKRLWQPNPPFKGLGTIMLQVAIRLSLDLEFDGRIGLHSLQDAEGFYRRREMTEFWPDPDYGYLTYFEMTASQAAKLLNNGGVQ